MANNEDLTNFLYNNTKELKEYLEVESPIGTLDSASTKMLSGLNITTRIQPERHRNKFKKYFFTRPMLNLSFFNLISTRKLARLMNKDVNSLERYVLNVLDPRQEYGEKNFYTHKDPEVSNEYTQPKPSSLINKYQPFIPLLSNTLMKSSGYLDTVLDTFTSSPGMRKEVWGWTNSINRIYTAWDMDTTFYNSLQEPSFLLFDSWIEYQSAVSEGLIWPWFDFLIGRRIDYTIGIFVLVLDKDMRSINHMAKTIAHPITNPNGKFYDFDIEANPAEELHDINMRWRCYGAEYDDPAILMDFNRYVCTFNPKLRHYVTDLNSYKEVDDYVEVPPDLYELLSNRCIPIIDIRYKKLEWLISKEDIKIIKKNFENNGRKI